MNSSGGDIGPNNRIGLRGIARDSTYNFIRLSISILLAFGISILLARGLGREGRGVFTLCLLLAEIIVAFTNMGISASSVFFVSRGEYEPDYVLRQNLSLSLWISPIAIAIGAGLILLLGDVLFPVVPTRFLLFSLLIIPISTNISFFTAVFQGMQDFRSFNLPGLLHQVTFLVSILFFVWFLHLGVMGALIAYISGGIISLLTFLVLSKRKISPSIKVPSRPDAEYLKKIYHYSIRIHFSNILIYLGYRIDNMILNGLAGAEAVGVYSIAVGLGERLGLPANAISSTVLPKISSLHKENEKQRVITPLLSRLVFTMTLPVVVFMALIANWLIPYFYGREFAASVQPFLFILPGILALNTGKILSNDLAGRGKAGLNLLISTISTATNVAANLILIPVLGASGAALSSSISYTLFTTLLIFSFSSTTSTSWFQLLIPSRSDLKLLKQALRLVWGRLKPGKIKSDDAI